MKVLSLYDGMSCGQIALERAGVKCDRYYASEIDKYAISITKKNYPNTKHLGDVTQVKSTHLPSICLLLGGSPCQRFSFAGKQLNFKDPRSALFFEFVRLLKEVKPKNFLLENVMMKKEYRDIISKYLGVEPILINSSLVSAQNRKRLYWTDIKFGVTPKDKGIMLRDIILKDNLKELYHTEKGIAYMNRRVKGGRNHWAFKHYSDTKNDKSAAVVANFFKGVQYNVLVDGVAPLRKFHPVECERLQTVPDNYTEGVSNTQRYKMLGNGWTVDVIAHILGGLPI